MSALVFTYRSPIGGGAGQYPEYAEDLTSAVRGVLAECVALGRSSGSISAAHHDPGQQHPFRHGGTGLGKALLFRTGDRSVHGGGDSQVATEARQALAAGDGPGWSLHPVRGSRTPLHTLQDAVPTRTYRVLSRYGYSTVEEVEATPDAGLRRMHGAGDKFIAGVRAAIADLELADRQPTEAPTAAPAAAAVPDTVRRRQLLVDQLDPGPALRDPDFIEGLAGSTIPQTALQVIAAALNAEPPPPASPAVVALLETAGEDAMLAYYTRTRTGGDQVAVGSQHARRAATQLATGPGQQDMRRGT